MYIYLSEVSLGLSLTNKHPSKSIYCPSPPIPSKMSQRHLKYPSNPQKPVQSLAICTKKRKNRCSSIAISEKLPTFALAFRKGAQNEIFERLRTRRKRQGSAAFREQPSDVNSYRNNKRIKQESLAGQTRASWAARTYI